MAWMTEDGKHDGWVATTFADGALGSGWGAPTAQQLGREVRTEDYGVLVTRIDGIDGRTLKHDDWQYRPPADVTGWVSACDCGWLGTPWIRVTEASEQNLAARRGYSGPADDSDAPREIDDACHAEWREHVGPHLILAEVADLAEQHTAIGHRLDKAVGRARAAGASWTDIGVATGMARQSAHERWRRITVPADGD